MMKSRLKQDWTNNMSLIDESKLQAAASGNPVHFSSDPIVIKCPQCKCQVITWTRQVASSLAWGLCAVLCMFMCWPFCFVPFCCPPLEETKHYCPNCNIPLGSHKKYKKEPEEAFSSSKNPPVDQESNCERWV